MARNYAAFLHEYLEEWEDLTDTEVGRLTRAILKYSATGEITKLPGSEKIAFRRAQKQEDRFKANYDDISKKRSEAGKKGMANRWAGVTNDNSGITNDNKNNQTETDTETNTDISPAIAGREECARDLTEEKKTYGRYVRLRLSEYCELMRELGLHKFRECRQYVDTCEQAQAIDEDGWADVIRKAARDGIGDD